MCFQTFLQYSFKRIWIYEINVSWGSVITSAWYFWEGEEKKPKISLHGVTYSTNNIPWITNIFKEINICQYKDSLTLKKKNSIKDSVFSASAISHWLDVNPSKVVFWLWGETGWCFSCVCMCISHKHFVTIAGRPVRIEEKDGGWTVWSMYEIILLPVFSRSHTGMNVFISTRQQPQAYRSVIRKTFWRCWSDLRSISGETIKILCTQSPRLTRLTELFQAEAHFQRKDMRLWSHLSIVHCPRSLVVYSDAVLQTLVVLLWSFQTDPSK